jgi:hypothetical protein
MVLTFASRASAGTYNVYSCADAPGDVNNAWTAADNDPAHLEQGASCLVPPQPTEQQLETSGLFSADVLNQSSGSPPGSIASWNLRAPAGAVFTHITYHRHLGKNLDNDWEPALSADGLVVPGETCSFEGSASGCVVDGFASLDVHAESLSLAIRCNAPSGVCATGSSAHDVFAALYASTVTISDPVPPSLSAPTGTIPASPPGAFHNASDSISFSASDNVGIRQTTVYVDGQPQSTIANPCDYTFVVPCLQQPAATHTIDWRALNLPDGSHQVQIAATDAAGNETRGSTTSVLVDTHPPTAPQGVPTSITQTRPTFPLSWTNPSQGPGAPIARVDYLLCPVAGPGRCVAGHGSGTDIHQLPITAPAHGHWRLALWLTDAAGNGTVADGASAQLAYLLHAGLRITSVSAHAGRITVSGVTAARGGRVTLTVRVRRQRHLHSLHRLAAIRRGRFRLTLRLPGGAAPVAGARAVVTFAGDVTHAPARVTRRL